MNKLDMGDATSGDVISGNATSGDVTAPPHMLTELFLNTTCVVIESSFDPGGLLFFQFFSYLFY